MSNRSNRRRYHDISSIEELRTHREKLGWQLEQAKANIEQDYVEVKNMFAFANIVRTAFSKIENIQSLVTGVREGYNSIADLFRKR